MKVNFASECCLLNLLSVDDRTNVPNSILVKGVLPIIYKHVSCYLRLDYLTPYLLGEGLVTQYDEFTLLNKHLSPGDRISHLRSLFGCMGDERRALFLFYRCLYQSGQQWGGPIAHLQLARLIRYHGKT